MPSEKCKGWHYCNGSSDIDSAEKLILSLVQKEAFGDDIDKLRKNLVVSNGSPLKALNPFIGQDGLIRMKGRISLGENKDQHPVIVPKGHVATLLISHFHEKVWHQGRHITEGRVRSEGYWIIGCSRLTSSILHRCVKCRILRGQPSNQLMAELPVDRTTPAAPFAHVGIDVFGPYQISTRRTRGGSANSKRWGLLFTCLVIRAVHIEVIEELSASSFLNAFRRFQSLRGKVDLIRSDNGTNFVAASKVLCVKWIFNCPRASHTGGVWERVIGITRRILDSMLHDNRRHSLTHEILSTFMAEACDIINSRPISTISHDATNPTILSPNNLLTMKFPSGIEFKDIRKAYAEHWHHVQNLAEIFWKRWRSEYLSLLEKRPKWQTKCENLQENNVVLVKDVSLPRTEWPLGIVTKTIPSDSDGLVRKVVVKLSKGNCFERHIKDIIKLC